MMNTWQAGTGEYNVSHHLRGKTTSRAGRSPPPLLRGENQTVELVDFCNAELVSASLFVSVVLE